MNLVKKKIKELNVAEYNPRKISDEALKGLKKSIETFGYVEPIIWNSKTNRIVGGHQRLKALCELGHKEVEVVEVSLGEKKEKALNVTLNNQAIQGEWDVFKLNDLIKEIDIDELNICLDKLKVDIEYIGIVDDLSSFFEKKEVVSREKKCPHCGGKL